jgi:hypothetical protein
MGRVFLEQRVVAYIGAGGFRIVSQVLWLCFVVLGWHEKEVSSVKRIARARRTRRRARH